MDLRFIAPDLRRLDRAATEVLVVSLALEDRPPHGVAGLVDWRLAGSVSQLIVDGFATGSLGEVVLVPGKPKLPFDKVLLFGVGESALFDERSFELVVEKMLATLEGLRARNAVVELPGRAHDAIDPERAVSLLQTMALGRTDHDVWTLVEPPDVQRTIQKQLVAARRRPV